MRSGGANLRRDTRRAAWLGAWHRRDTPPSPRNPMCIRALPLSSEVCSEQLPLFGARCGTAGTQAHKVDYTRSVGWRVTLLLSIACLATSPAVHSDFARAATPPFPRTIEDRCALSVLAGCDDGKAALRMSASASLDTKSDVGLTPRTVRLALLTLTCATAAVWLSSRALLSTNFLPHWYCFVGNTRLLWTRSEEHTSELQSLAY